MTTMPAELFGVTVKDNTLRSGLRKAMVICNYQLGASWCPLFIDLANVAIGKALRMECFFICRKVITPMDFQSLIVPILVAMSLPSAVTGFCFWLLEQRIKKRDDEQKEAELKRQKKSDERDAQRKEYEICQLNMTAASMALAEATAQAVQRIPDAHCNGDMHKALDYAAKVKNDQKDFLRKRAIDNMDF